MSPAGHPAIRRATAQSIPRHRRGEPRRGGRLNESQAPGDQSTAPRHVAGTDSCHRAEKAECTHRWTTARASAGLGFAGCETARGIGVNPASGGTAGVAATSHTESREHTTARRRERLPRDPRRGDRVSHGAIVPAARPAPPRGRLRQRARFAGRPIPSKHNDVLRGLGPDRGTAATSITRIVARPRVAVISSLSSHALLPIVRSGYVISGAIGWRSRRRSMRPAVALATGGPCRRRQLA